MIEEKYRPYLTKFNDFNCDTIYVAGSHAYGLATENSDIDIRGFIIRSGKDILLSKDFESIRLPQEDVCFYSFDKFVKMLAAANPNIIEFLGITKNIKLGPIGRYIQENKDMFLSKKIATTFLGFAHSEQKRLEKMPFFETKKIQKAQCHFIRICRMGIEMLTNKIVNTNREGIDSDELKVIKQGCYLREHDIDPAWFELVNKEIEKLYEAERISELPQEPDYERINQLIIDVNGSVVYENINRFMINIDDSIFEQLFPLDE